MTPVLDPFMADVRPTGLQRGRGGFLRSADDAPYVTDPTGEVCKTGERKGEVKRLKYGSPSNRGREIENDAGLVKYKQRLSLAGIGMDPTLADACRELANLPVGSPEFNTAADTIVVQADRLTRSSLAADRGTHGHALTEWSDRFPEWQTHREAQSQWDVLWPLGEAVGLRIVTQTDTIAAWRNLLTDNGLQVLAIEASCVDDKWRLAGTLDRIVRTTRPLTFVKSSGELVTIPANTVLVLDIKFGKCRLAHPIQIASYAQSVPYDTDTETRGEWGFELSHEHALIAHGDFGDDLRPVTIELVWVDLVAGREHGGETVVQAKAWAARDDVFSVAMLGDTAAAVFAPAIAQLLADAPTPSVSAIAGEVEACGTHPLTAFPAANVEGLAGSLPVPPSTVGKGGGTTLARAGFESLTAPPDPVRLALVDARATLTASPDEGGDWSGDEFKPVWDELKALFDNLDPDDRAWRANLAESARWRLVDFLAQGGRTERRYYINKAVIGLALAGEGDDILRELLAHIIGDAALYPGVEPGHALGSLTAGEAERFATHVDAYLAPPPAA